jgi:uncharacterized protein YciI
VFLVFLSRSGPQYDHSLPLQDQSGWAEHAAYVDEQVDAGVFVMGGPLSDDRRVVTVVEAESEAEVRAVLARDPWSRTHLSVDAIEPWTIKFDGRPRRS